jgi:hypothetical protein
MNSFQEINIMIERVGSHLRVPPVGCPCSVEGPIPVAPPTHQWSHNSSPYIFQEYTYSHLSISYITQS